MDYHSTIQGWRVHDGVQRGRTDKEDLWSSLRDGMAYDKAADAEPRVRVAGTGGVRTRTVVRVRAAHEERSRVPARTRNGWRQPRAGREIVAAWNGVAR